VSEPQPGSLAREDLTAGGVLAAARAERGLSVAEVAQRLKFSTRQIEALEADRYEALSSPPFVRGMVRSYAKLLEIDAAPLLASLERKVGTVSVEMQPHGMSVPFPADRSSGSRVYVLLSMLIVLAVAVILAEWFIRSQRVAEPVAVAPPAARPLPPPVASLPAPPAPVAAPDSVPARTAAAPAPPAVASPSSPADAALGSDSGGAAKTALTNAAPVPPGRARVVLNFGDESWVEIRDGSGEVIFSGLNRAGTRRVIQGAAPMSIVIGNAMGVRLTYNNATVDLAPHTRVDVARLTLE
jgi:cytoskeleton protein RodZ